MKTNSNTNQRRRIVRIKTVTRANGRTFSVAIYNDGTTADLDWKIPKGGLDLFLKAGRVTG